MRYSQEEINEMQAEIKQARAERDLKAGEVEELQKKLAVEQLCQQDFIAQRDAAERDNVRLRSEVEELRTALTRLQTLATSIVYGDGLIYREFHSSSGNGDQATCTCCLSSAENTNQIQHETGCQAVLLQNLLTELNRDLSGSCYED